MHHLKISLLQKKNKTHPASLSWCAVLAGSRWSHSLAKLVFSWFRQLARWSPSLTSLNATKIPLKPASTPLWPSVKGMFFKPGLGFFFFLSLSPVRHTKALTFKSWVAAGEPTSQTIISRKRVAQESVLHLARVNQRPSKCN